jgi:hypothetical protein
LVMIGSFDSESGSGAQNKNCRTAFFFGGGEVRNAAFVPSEVETREQADFI